MNKSSAGACFYAEFINHKGLNFWFHEHHVGLAGRKFLIDVVVLAPERFSTLARVDLERVMPSFHPAIFSSLLPPGRRPVNRATGEGKFRSRVPWSIAA